jgi:D-3-phosphoglycerate dehydrogenase / 2-oxoglutarate reductase
VEIVSFEDLLKRADFISLHTTLTADTRSLIGEEQLKLVKPSARIINTARGPLIDEEALCRAIDEGRLAGAAIDVFAQEPPPPDSPLLKNDRILVTPHLGASTTEAQERVAVDVAEQIVSIFKGEPALYAVNAPLIAAETMSVIAPYLEVAVKTASLATQLSEGQLGKIEIEYLGEIANLDVTPLKAAVIRGLLSPVSEENVTIVNANLVAEHRGLRITERKGPYEGIYANLISVRLTTTAGTTTVAGTMAHDGPHVVSLNDYWVDIPPDDVYLLICENEDRPGIIGFIGSYLGQHDVNISFMRVGREKVRGRAVMVLGLDDSVTAAQLEEIQRLPHIFSARLARI